MLQISSIEKKNLIHRCLDLRIAVQLVGILVSAVLRRLVNRMISSRLIFYAPGIRVLALATCKVHSLALKNVSRIHGVSDASYSLQGPRRLWLAIGCLEFTDEPDWQAQFDDEEQFLSLHRWNWLLRALTDESPSGSWDWGASLVRSWLGTKGALPPGPASESYTVGERIANLCMFSRVHHGNWQALPEEFQIPLYEMATYLARRLEFQPSGLTGNHVLNNARAMLFFGHTTGDSTYVELARALLSERLPVLILEGGFLREGSSHYQFLFTRWVIECWLVAYECGDKDTLGVLEPFLPSLISACRFFLVENGRGGFHLPTFGDISPDFDPQWLLYLPFVATKQLPFNSPVSLGWSGLVRRTFVGPLANLPCSQDDSLKDWQCYPKAGWFRLDHEGWVALWHVEASDGHAIGSHAHHDLGSVVLFRFGHEVLIDPGRMSYEARSSDGNHATSAYAHSSLVLSGFGPMLSTRDRFLPRRYRIARATVVWNGHEQVRELMIEHNGFSRIAGAKILHLRKFVLTPNEMVIKDNLEGVGAYTLDQLLQQPWDDAKSQSPVLEFETDLPPSCFKFSKITCGLGFGWRYPAYGVRTAAKTWRANGQIVLPFSWTCRFRDEEVAKERLQF